LCVLEYERGAEDDQLVPPDGGRGGEPLVLQRDAERHVGRVPVRLLRRLLLQERVQARQSGLPTGKGGDGTKRIKKNLKNKPQKWRACKRMKFGRHRYGCQCHMYGCRLPSAWLSPVWFFSMVVFVMLSPVWLSFWLSQQMQTLHTVVFRQQQVLASIEDSLQLSELYVPTRCYPKKYNVQKSHDIVPLKREIV
jgi:hypothetical protein